MLQTSLPFARILGVEVRVHVSLILLLLFAVGCSVAVTGDAERGLGLGLAWGAALAVCEATRALTALYLGLPLRGVLLLPIGGAVVLDAVVLDAMVPDAMVPDAIILDSSDTVSSPDRSMDPSGGAGAATHGATSARSKGSSDALPGAPRLLLLMGPLANFATGALLLGIVYALVPEIALFRQPWISLNHVLRSAIALQFLLGAINLLPPAALPIGNWLHAQPGSFAAPSSRSTFRDFGGALAVSLLLLGFAVMSLWIVMLGSAFLFTAQLRSVRAIPGLDTGSVLVRDAMLRDYTVLSSSDTFRGALDRISQSLQDIFPVLRGDLLVGAISRSVIAGRLRAEGDGYLQGAMNRTLQSADPGETLSTALRRAAELGASELIPVVENGAVLGIVTPQSMLRAGRGRRLVKAAQLAENNR